MLEKIKKILLTHKGKSNVITSAKIAVRIGIQEDATYAQTRSLIRECVKKYKLPLAANNRGYYLIVDKQEYAEYMANLDSRIDGIKERKRMIMENFKGWEK